MTHPLLRFGQNARRLIPLGTLALGGAGCTRVHYIYPTNMQGYSLPVGCPKNTPPTNSTELNACLQGLEFDTTESVGDKQRLMVVEPATGTGAPCHGDPSHKCRHGPLAKIEPVKGAHLYSDEALAQGRFIARLYLEKDETESYAKLGLIPKDTTYWWVNTKDQTSILVTRGTRGEVTSTKPRALERNAHAKGSFQQSFASWVWDEKDETLNAGCGSSCCKPR